jgi:hypothetical protein
VILIYLNCNADTKLLLNDRPFQLSPIDICIVAGAVRATIRCISLSDSWCNTVAKYKHKEQLLNNPVGYTPEIKEHLNWLKCGKDAFDNNPLAAK